MPIIDAKGLFSGSRLRSCTDGARLRWPYYFLASNGYARLELDPALILASTFIGFKEPITEDLFWSDVREYQQKFLMFVYRCDGKLWGQWDCPSGLLNKYHTKADKDSPIPPETDFKKWKQQYQQLTKFSEISQKLQKVSENLPLGIVVGVVDVVGADSELNSSTQQKSGEPCEPPCADLDLIARSLASDLAADHARFSAGPSAELRLQHLLASALNPQAVAESIRDSHARFCVEWTQRRHRNSRCFIPNLCKWLDDGDYLNPPGQSNRRPAAMYRCGECGDTGKVVLMNADNELTEQPCPKCGGKAAA